MLGTTSKKARIVAYETRLATHPTNDAMALKDFKDGESGIEYRLNGVISREKVSSAYVDEMSTAGVLSKNYVHTLTQPITFESTTVSLGTIPASRTLVGFTVVVSTGFTSGAKITVGKSGSLSAYLADSDVVITTTGTKTVSKSISISTSAEAILTLTGTELEAGEATVTLRYL